jgi:hypothetical protein
MFGITLARLLPLDTLSLHYDMGTQVNLIVWIYERVRQLSRSLFQLLL